MLNNFRHHNDSKNEVIKRKARSQKIDRIEIRPIPYELPVKIFVPGFDFEYDTIL